ncbi:HWE histidine kinase domain-containing protein [Paracraurococcus lichenis]|uniref:histidine kinase n=1 Tax=Paracraurococcus lichenis TaxID=3064888 RepID=A0ABT9E3G3_9PROT|nr:HWE histidine kinase domain-containing protein [Paracraurococcus sp. LOR1-02]MDO9710693.1 HWE histidine kinase domain-containing protein [Paracraurococcus sp. LOR1-02]
MFLPSPKELEAALGLPLALPRLAGSARRRLPRGEASKPARPARRRLGWLRAVLVATLVLPGAAMVATAWQGWHEVWESAGRELQRGADAGAEYALRVTEGQRLAGDLANDLLRGLSDAEIRAREAELHESLRALLPRLPLVQTIAMSDRDAHMLVTANIYPVPRDVSIQDREWVQALRAPDAPALHVSGVHVGRIDGNLFYGITRRRSGSGNGLPERAYDGAINVSVNPNSVAAGFLALGGEPADVTALVRADGEVLVRTPGFPDPLPAVPEGSPLRRAIAAGQERGSYLGLTLGFHPDRPGEGRLIAFRRVGTLPLYVTVARPTPVIAARWRRSVLQQLAIALPITLMLFGLAWLALRRTEAAAMAEEALRREAAERAAAEAARAAEARFRGVFESRAIGMSVFDLASGKTILANDRLLEMTGGTREAFAAGRWDWRRVTPTEHLPLDDRAVEQARARGWWEPFEKEYLQPDGSRLPVRLSSAPLPGEPGRVVVFVQDITQQREAELRRDLMMREMDHRAKNALAMARSALRLTRAPTMEAFVRELDGRIGSLAQAIALLADTGWHGAELGMLARAELAPFLGGGTEGPSVTLDGPPLVIRSVATQPLAMALHELATNAIKYGALSACEGRVTLRWAEEGEVVRLTWQERGGPPIAQPPAGRGFGTRVLQATIARQLGGRLEQRWDPEGLTCEMALPAAKVLAEAEPADQPGRSGQHSAIIGTPTTSTVMESGSPSLQ